MTRPHDPVTAEPYELQETLGYRITAWEKDYARVEMELRNLHLNRNRLPHGGIYSLLLDCACAFCGTCPGEDEVYRPAVTLSLTVSFIGTPKGKHLIAEGRKTGGGKTNFFSEAALRDDLGNLVSSATATLRYLPPKG